MPSRFSHTRGKERLVRRQPPKAGDHHHVEDVEDKGHGMSLIRKILLSAELMGMEASVNFEQIYTVPVLQTLGMPLSLSFLNGLISGFLALLILPCLSWLADNGKNPLRRRMITIVFAAGLLISGMLVLFVAFFLHIQDLLDYESHRNSTLTPSFVENTSGIGTLDADFVVNRSWNLYQTDSLGKGTYNYSSTEMSGLKPAEDTSSSVSNDESSVPFKAGLGFVGFVLMDLGFDSSYCFVKGFVVSCSARSEHTSLLVLGLIIASVGGVITAVLGLVDFVSLLGVDYIEGAEMIIQASMQGAAVIVIVVTGLIITLITGNRQLRHNNEHNNNADKDVNNHIIVPKPDEELTRSTVTDAFENSIRSFGGPGVYFEPHYTVPEDNNSVDDEEIPLLSEEEKDVYEEIGGAYLLSASVSYDTLGPAHASQDLTHLTIEEEDEEKGYKDKEYSSQSGCIQNPNIKIAFICCSVFFASGFTLMVTYSISDFIGKAVYQGDPNGDPGSDSLIRYQAGMRMASWAFVVYYTTYLVASIAQSRILRLLGCRVEFILIHLVAAFVMLITAMTARLESVIVLTVMAGMTRVCFHSLPFAVTSSIAHSMEASTGGKNMAGMAVSLVASFLPLSYILLFSWIGAAEAYTGNPAVPLYLGFGFGCLSSIAFFFVGKV